MKVIIYICFISASFFLLNSCKSKKNAANNGNAVNNTVNDHPSTSTNGQANPPGTYRLVVSFVSRGEGIDRDKKEEFEKLLSTYSVKLNYERVNWGREGEVDYCLNLAELKENDKIDFVDKTKNLLTSSKLVNILENKPCIHRH